MIRPRVLEAVIDLSTEDDYCLKVLYFAISRQENIILVLRVYFSLFKLFRRDFEVILRIVREPLLVYAILKRCAHCFIVLCSSLLSVLTSANQRTQANKGLKFTSLHSLQIQYFISMVSTCTKDHGEHRVVKL